MCPLSSLLIVVLQTFSKDADILPELVHLQEQPRETRPESPINCVRRAVWGMLYADDAYIVSRLTRILAKIREAIVHVCDAFGLTVFREKYGDHVHSSAAYSTGSNALESRRAPV